MTELLLEFGPINNDLFFGASSCLFREGRISTFVEIQEFLFCIGGGHGAFFLTSVRGRFL